MSKRNTISQLLRVRRDWLDSSIASILLGLSAVGVPTALGQCHPATPNPCAADGQCNPKRDTWGNYTTHWRPYPGDTIGLTPTPAEGGPVDLQQQLPTFIVPTPDKEDQRGPIRPTRPAASAGAQPAADGLRPAEDQPFGQAPPANDAQPAEPAAEEPAPGPLDGLDLPGFGPPQGSLQQLPQIEDGPPALPGGLMQALTMGSEASLPGGMSTSARAIAAPAAAANAGRSVPKVTIVKSREVAPVSANIELTNPAAMSVQKTMDQDLQQAIYYEASDIDTTMK